MRPPEDWNRARVTLAIAGLTAIAWALAASLNLQDEAAIWAGFIPARVGLLPNDGSLAPLILTPLSATLVHSGVMHLLFNLLMLLFCGRPTEAIIGSGQLLILYVVGAYAAATAAYLASPDSVIPGIGASGAVAAILGAYSILFGRNRVKIANPTAALWLNALWLLAAWIGLQMIVALTFKSADWGVVVGAHIGGFLAGLLLAKPLLLFRYRRA